MKPTKEELTLAGPWTARYGTAEDQRYVAPATACMILDAPGWGAFGQIVVKTNGEGRVTREGLDIVSLITAAPDLLEALEEADILLAAIPSVQNMQRVKDALAANRAAIAKAKGES